MPNKSKLYVIETFDVGSTPGSPSGLRLTSPSTTTIGVAAGQAPDSVSGAVIDLPTAVVINLAVNGALGLDTGAVAAASSYAVWLLKNPTTDAVTAVASLSFTLGGVTKPTGFTLGRRIGSVHTLAAAATLLLFTQEGSGADRRYHFLLSNAARNKAIAHGATTEQELDLSSCLPSTATSVRVTASVLCTGGTAGSALSFGLNTLIASGIVPITAADITAAITKVVQMDVPVGILTTAAAVGLNTTVNDTDPAPSLVVEGYTETL